MVTPLASACACTSVVKGLTNTDCAPLLPVAGDCSVNAVPTALPVSLSTAVAGTTTTTRCWPATAASTSKLKRPAASVGPELGSPLSQAPLSLRS